MNSPSVERTTSLPTSPEHCRNRCLATRPSYQLPHPFLLGEERGVGFASEVILLSFLMQKERVDLQKSFSSWKIRHTDDKREVIFIDESDCAIVRGAWATLAWTTVTASSSLLQSFTTTLARNHHHRKLKGRVWAAWFGVVQGRWKLRMERACQVRTPPQN